MDYHKKISIIIPVYNTEKYIGRCLKSVLANTYQNIEVICINDGSTDSSLSILEKYAASDQRIKIINQKNAGVSAARNAGLDAVTGDFVTFVDSDDWIHHLYFETLIYFQKETNASIVCCTWKNVLSEEIEFSGFEKKDLKVTVLDDLEQILNNNVAKRIVCGHLYLAEMICKNYFETELKYGEDTFFNISLICQNPDIIVVLIEKDLYFYYKRWSSACYTLNWTTRICLPRKYLEYLENSFNKNREVYLSEACKAILAFRYDQSFSLEDKIIKLECARMISNCKRKLRSFNGISLKKRLIYNIFFDFPFVYRIFRIVSDKTLLEWERRQKGAKSKFL